MDDVSYRGADRMAVRIRVADPLSRAEIEALCMDLLKRAVLQRQDAVAFFFYLPDTNPRGLFTAGKAEWAPFGDWSRASRGRNKKDHALSINVGHAFGQPLDPSWIEGSIPNSKRRHIYHDILVAEDAGVAAAAAQRAAAARHGVTQKQVKNICLEGTWKGWE